MHLNKDFYHKWHPFLIKELSLFLKREAQIEGGKQNHLSQLWAAFLSLPSRLNCTVTDCFAFKGHAICCWRYCEYVICLWNWNIFSTAARWCVQENDNLMLKIYCLGEHRVCRVGEAFHEQYWIPFEALATPPCRHISLPLCIILNFASTRAHCVCFELLAALWRKVIKRPFIWARLLWWVCHFVQCTKPSWGDSLVCLTSQTGWWVWIEPHRARRQHLKMSKPCLLHTC